MNSPSSGPLEEIGTPYSKDVAPQALYIAPFDELFSRPSVFMSASVADPARGNEYRSPLQPAHLIRDAVIQLGHFVFARGWNLVFGGHPTISPMVLAVARNRLTGNEKLVVAFQSLVFKNVIPAETVQLWEHGSLLLTPQLADEPSSLAEMRRLMVTVPDLRAAIFIGGMKGVREESEAFDLHNPACPRFALGSTGSAAADLLNREPNAHCGDNPGLLETLRDNRAYAVVMRRIFAVLDKKP